DRNVTGVQTCALPISCGELGPSRLLWLGLSRWARARAQRLWIGAHPTILTRPSLLRYLPVLEIGIGFAYAHCIGCDPERTAAPGRGGRARQYLGCCAATADQPALGQCADEGAGASSRAGAAGPAHPGSRTDCRRPGGHRLGTRGGGCC